MASAVAENILSHVARSFDVQNCVCIRNAGNICISDSYVLHFFLKLSTKAERLMIAVCCYYLVFLLFFSSVLLCSYTEK